MIRRMNNFLTKVKIVWNKINEPSYDNYSIAEYFRSQGAQIGQDCYFGIRELAGEPYLVRIGNHVQISSNVQLLTHNPGWCFRHKIPDLQVFGTITINDNCYIGADSIILLGITIGENSIIAAGSVVTKDIPPNSVAAGNPTSIIASIEKYQEKATKLWAIQRPKGYLSEIDQTKIYTSEELHHLFHIPENREKLKKHLIRLFQQNNKKGG